MLLGSSIRILPSVITLPVLSQTSPWVYRPTRISELSLY
ncbi:unnamed protein product [Linum tenue]|uniref:Uncharacterized protein n=1 Tax=Linum tenue TaxID=586396 RepID=A0AAV0JJ14_9ROSI|nr:unnamed protein product [Linum tenue]